MRRRGNKAQMILSIPVLWDQECANISIQCAHGPLALLPQASRLRSLGGGQSTGPAQEQDLYGALQNVLDGDSSSLPRAGCAVDILLIGKWASLVISIRVLRWEALGDHRRQLGIDQRGYPARDSSCLQSPSRVRVERQLLL